jgi:hypothetical protein
MKKEKKGGDGGVYIVAEALADHWWSLGFPLVLKTGSKSSWNFLSVIVIASLHSAVASGTHRQVARGRVARPDNSSASRMGWSSRINVHSCRSSALD